MRRRGGDVLRWLVAMLIVSAATMAQAAAPRIALVIGNSAYNSVAALDNPVPDAQLISRRLQETGFEVTLVINASLAELRGAISTFGKELRAAGPEATGLFYYAGHGVQSFGANYLLPVDAELSDAADLDLVSLEAASVLRQMASARNRTNIMILDACRDNPFESIPDLNENGLAEMKAPTGTFLAYATSPGAVAYDGSGENSPFTSALSKQLMVADQPIEETFRNVRVAVLSETGGLQTPWDTSSLTNAFFFAESEPLSEEDRAAKALWDQVKVTRDPIQILLFLRAYPGSVFEDEARAMLAAVVDQELDPGAEPPVAAAPAPTPVPGQETVVPADRERQLIETARRSGTLADYEAYLAEFPDGAYAELAKFEVTILREKAAAAPTPAPEPAPAEQVATLVPAPAPSGPVTLNSPIQNGPEQLRGLTIMEAIKGSPLHPPLEGLPESYWKDQTCSNCHQWTPDALCAQAQVYTGEIAERSLSKEHPYGGAFKQHLRQWAMNSCAE